MEANQISYKSFQVILFKEMDTDNPEAIYCDDDGEYRVYCNICNRFCFEQLYKNHLNSQTHIINPRKKKTNK